MFVYSNNHPTNYTPPQIPNSKSCTVPSSKKTVIYFPCFKRCALSFLQHFFFSGGRFFQKCAVHQSPLQPPSQDIPRSLFLVNRSLALVMFLKPRPLDGHGLNPWKRPGWLRRALGPWGSIYRDHEFTGSWSHQLLNDINLGKLLGLRQPDCFYYRTCLGLIFFWNYHVFSGDLKTVWWLFVTCSDKYILIYKCLQVSVKLGRYPWKIPLKMNP